MAKKIRLRRLLMTLILIAIMIVCTVGISLSFHYEKYVGYELQSFKEILVDAKYIDVFNLYGIGGNMAFSEFLKEKDALDRLKALYLVMKKAGEMK